MKEKRFVKTYEQEGLLFGAAIIVDTVTGVNYLLGGNGSFSGLTALLDAEGRPVVTSVKPEYQGPELR